MAPITHTGGTAAPRGQTVVQRVESAAAEQHVAAIADTLALDASAVHEWASARYEDGTLRLSVHAAAARREAADGSPSYGVNTSLDVEASEAVQRAFERALETQRPVLHRALKVALARSLIQAAAESQAGNGQEGPTP